MSAAACEDAETNLFFSEPDDPDHDERTAAAKALCSGCTVRQECLEGALDRKEQYGIWGGLTAAERKTYLRKLKRLLEAQAS